MNIVITKEQEKTLVAIAGKVDTTLSAEMKQTFDDKIADGSQVEIDARKLEYITSSALRVFLALYKRMNASGGSLIFTNVQPTVMQIFNLTGFDSFVSFE